MRRDGLLHRIDGLVLKEIERKKNGKELGGVRERGKVNAKRGSR